MIFPCRLISATKIKSGAGTICNSLVRATADRIVVMSEGRAVHEAPIADADLRVIGRHMAGHGS